MIKNKNNLVVFPIAGMREREKKYKLKNKVAGSRMAYYPFFSKCESQYSKLYCETGLDRHGFGDRPGCAVGVQGARRVGHYTTGWATIQATTRPREATT